MIDAGRITETTEVQFPMPIGAAGGAQTSAKLDATQDGMRRARAQSIDVEEIATDSAQVSEIGALISQAGQVSDVRFEKVASLRQAIQAGMYRVSAEALAESIMAELLRPRPGRATGVDEA
jgi:flagellar biosynthesis anti-sigma factor FlgM